MAKQEFSFPVGKDCWVQVDGNGYSMAAALVRQNMMVTISDQEGLIRKGG